MSIYAKVFSLLAALYLFVSPLLIQRTYACGGGVEWLGRGDEGLGPIRLAIRLTTSPWRSLQNSSLHPMLDGFLACYPHNRIPKSASCGC